MDQEQVAVRSFTSDVTDNVEPPKRTYRKRRKTNRKANVKAVGTLTATGRRYTKLMLVDGSTLRLVRKRQAMTLKELAAACEVSYVSIQRMETSETCHAYPATIEKVAQVLSVPVSLLVRNDNRMTVATASA